MAVSQTIDEGCFDSTTMDDFIESIRNREIKMERYRGAHKCVRSRLESAPPSREFVRDGTPVSCFDKNLISDSVVECAFSADRMASQF